MHIGTTSITGEYDDMEKLYQINHQFKVTYVKTLHHKHYGGIITGTIIVPISVYEEEGEDQKIYKKMYLEKIKIGMENGNLRLFLDYISIHYWFIV